MNIGQAADASGVPAKTIRYYEGIGLIPAAERTGSGYRVYSGADVHRLRFIRRARELGFPMETVEHLLSLWQDRNRSRSEVMALARRHAEGLERKIAEMQDMKNTLLHLAEHSHGDDRPECPILDDFSGREQQRSA